MTKHLNFILFLVFCSCTTLSAQQYFAPNPSVSVQSEKILSFLSGIPEIAKKTEYYNLSQPVLQTILVLQSNAGASVADRKHNYGRVVMNPRLSKFDAFNSAIDGFIVCNSSSRGVEATALCLHFLRKSEKNPLTDTKWLTLIFGPEGDLFPLASEANSIYKSLTGQSFKDLGLKFGNEPVKASLPLAVKINEQPTAPENKEQMEPNAAEVKQPDALMEERKQDSAPSISAMPQEAPSKAISQKPAASSSDDQTVETPSNIWSANSNAQTSRNTEEKRTILFLGGGYRSLKYDDLDIYFNYTDESPSQDNISTYFNLPRKSNVGTLHLGVEQAYPSKLVLRLSGEVYLNKVKGGGVDFGLGYLLGNVAGFHVRPSLGLGMNYTSVKLGDIYQNDLFIQVNDTKFYSESVAVSVTSPSLSLRPELAVGIPLGDEFELRAGIGYHLNLASFGADLKFSGKGQENESLSATKPLDAANANLTIDGERLKTSFAKPQGIFLNLCIGWKL